MSHLASFALSVCAVVACAACAASPTPAARRRDLVTFVTSDERLQIQTPMGKGWRCLNRRFEPEEGVPFSSFINCGLQTSQGELTLEFTYMEIAAYEEVPSAEELCKDRYPTRRQEEYADARVMGTRAISHQGRAGCEVTIVATNAVNQSIRIVDRVFVAGTRILHGTAIATPAFFDAHQADVERWFASASFAPLK